MPMYKHYDFWATKQSCTHSKWINFQKHQDEEFDEFDELTHTDSAQMILLLPADGIGNTGRSTATYSKHTLTTNPLCVSLYWE